MHGQEEILKHIKVIMFGILHNVEKMLWDRKITTSGNFNYACMLMLRNPPSIGNKGKTLLFFVNIVLSSLTH